jgi:sRNA-binding regulator protein Hfq
MHEQREPLLQVGPYTYPRPAERSIGTRTPSTPKVSGHDTVLRAIKNKGSMISVFLQSGESRMGTLIAYDKYTLTVKTADGRRRVIFKSAVEEFFGDESAPAEFKVG